MFLTCKSSSKKNDDDRNFGCDAVFRDVEIIHPTTWFFGFLALMIIANKSISENLRFSCTLMRLHLSQLDPNATPHFAWVSTCDFYHIFLHVDRDLDGLVLMLVETFS